MEIVMNPIGYIRNNVTSKKDISWGEDYSTIVLEEQYAMGLKGLEEFSHAIILFYLDQAVYDKEKHLQRRAQNRDDMPLVGIFSQRGKDRPNQIGMTSVSIVSVSEYFGKSSNGYRKHPPPCRFSSPSSHMRNRFSHPHS